MVRWMYGISLTVWSDVVKQNQLRWVGHVLWKDGYWMKKCMSDACHWYVDFMQLIHPGILAKYIYTEMLY